MTDRELLERAAKAVGNNASWGRDDPFKLRDMILPSGTHWNPLDDDGDAFRLMVDLNLYGKHSLNYTLGVESDNLSDSSNYREPMRRAIVIAAAQMVESDE